MKAAKGKGVEFSVLDLLFLLAVVAILVGLLLGRPVRNWPGMVQSALAAVLAAAAWLKHVRLLRNRLRRQKVLVRPSVRRTFDRP